MSILVKYTSVNCLEWYSWKLGILNVSFFASEPLTPHYIYIYIYTEENSLRIRLLSNDPRGRNILLTV